MTELQPVGGQRFRCCGFLTPWILNKNGSTDDSLHRRMTPKYLPPTAPSCINNKLEEYHFESVVETYLMNKQTWSGVMSISSAIYISHLSIE